MDAQSRQQALDNLSAEDLAKVQAHQASTEGALPVDNEWMLLAEFGKAFGWQAYLDAKNDARDQYGNLIVTTEEMLTLIEANRKLEAIAHYKNAEASFVGAASAQSRTPSQTFKSLTREIIKLFKVRK